MPRPCKCRRIDFTPDTYCFKPAGIPIRDLTAVILTLDELEAIRLADQQGLYQEEAAKCMNVSRQTFGNIILSAHRKIADALINQKYIQIKGGNIMMPERQFLCEDCRHGWSAPPGAGSPIECPNCHSTNFQRHPEDQGEHGRDGCCRRRQLKLQPNDKRSKAS